MGARRALAAALVVAALLAPAASAAGPGAADLAAARRGAAWLDTASAAAPAGARADAIVAMAAGGRGRAALRRRLAGLSRIAPAYARTAGGAAKVVMAAVAAGADPRRLGGVDYVARVQRAYAAGRYGASAIDQALSMLALAAAGEPVPAGAVSAVRATRAAGGWGFTLGPGSPDDVSTTGLLIEALRAGGVPARDPVLRDAATWMLAQRNAQGGLALAGGGRPTEADATAIAEMALRALGRTPPAAMRAALRALQGPDGSVAFTAGSAGSRLLATNDAVPALAGRHLPPPFPSAGGAE